MKGLCRQAKTSRSNGCEYVKEGKVVTESKMVKVLYRVKEIKRLTCLKGLNELMALEVRARYT